MDTAVKEFQTRPLEGDYPFLTVDATYFKVRENSRIISKAFMIACGTNAEGHREILGFGVYANESSTAWAESLLSLKKRGLTGLLMITSDAHEGILNAIGKVFPTVPWQRCQFRFSRNITDKAPKKYQTGLRTELQELFNCKTMSEARKVRDGVQRSLAFSPMRILFCVLWVPCSWSVTMPFPKKLNDISLTQCDIRLTLYDILAMRMK